VKDAAAAVAPTPTTSARSAIPLFMPSPFRR
jgi:hypothetical protein